MRKCAVCGRTSNELQINFCTSYGDYLCSKHKNQWHRHGRITDNDVISCEVCGITSNETKIHWCSKANKYLCLKHRSQFNRLGHFLKRTGREQNEYVIGEECAFLVFRDRDCNIQYMCPIDEEDIEKMSSHKWTITEPHGNTRYIRAVEKRKVLFLHRFLLHPEKNEIIDHINRNGLDNRKSNLRIVSISENCVNSKTNSRTKEKNIYFHNGKYRVEIIRNYKRVYTKSFKTIEEAIEARNEFIKKYNLENNRLV